MDRTTGSIVGEVCHIKGEKRTAARYDEDQDDFARHGFENLILMCNVHHKVIDDNPDEYRVEDLISMKEQHEIRQDGKEAIDDSLSDAFASAAIHYFEQHVTVEATTVNGGQFANTIINQAPQSDDGPVVLEGRITISATYRGTPCPHLELTIICRSKRPAKIRRAMLSLHDHGILASFEAGFGETFERNQLPGSDEELLIDFVAVRKPDLPDGFVLQQDDVVTFILPAIAAPLELFAIRPPSAMCLKVEFFDRSDSQVIQGEDLKGVLEGLLDIAQKVPCKIEFPPFAVRVRTVSTKLPDIGPIGKMNPYPLNLGLRIGDPRPPSQVSEKLSPDKDARWFKRRGSIAPYPGLLQGPEPHCVYAAVAGAVNFLMQRAVWTISNLFAEHQKDGPKAADWAVANTALVPVADEIEHHHHNRDHASRSLSPTLIREWISDGAVVIISMELEKNEAMPQGGWHMFTLSACEDDLFQVWDTNGFAGFLTADDIQNGFFYPNGWFFKPHDKEDAFVLKRKRAKG